MKRDLPRALSVTVALMTMTLAGCKTSDRAGPAPSNPAVQIPRECEELAKDYSMPPLVKGQSAKVALVRTRVVLAGAIDSLGDTRECQVDQRERFARGAVR